MSQLTSFAKRVLGWGPPVTLLTAGVCLSLCVGRADGDIVVHSRHNLSVSGPGPVRSAVEEEVCIFCHTPHRARADAPLWNRADSNAVYLTYTSDTLDAPVGQPTGASRLCLSCHDGTVALGAVLSRPAEIRFKGGQRFVEGRSNLGTDLRDDHPISFPYRAALGAGGDLRPESAIHESVKLDARGEVQCTSCHDPHDNARGNFLCLPTAYSVLCLACHEPPGWTGSAHQSSTARWRGFGEDPWPQSEAETVAENGCGSCHRVHQAEGPTYLLGNASEEGNCLKCHDGSVDDRDLTVEFAKRSTHPIEDFSDKHRAREQSLDMPRHVECTDCHSAHQARAGSGSPPAVPPSMMGVPGVNLSGTEIGVASYAYEVCFRCHGDTARASLRVPRQVVSANTRREFSPWNPSFHPVAGPRNNAEVPSLVSRYSTSSVIYCHDCHGNPRGRRFGGGGPDGPHGSDYHSLLSAQYDTGDPQQEGPTAYELCYRCHSRASILGDESFPTHRLHIVDAQTPCSVCHDPHGIPADAGSPLEHTHLINFDVSVVFPDPVTGRRGFEDLGRFRGRCAMLCHDRAHSPESY